MRSPIEKVVEIVKVMLESFDDDSIKKELNWAIQKITSNKLYEPLIEEGNNKSDAQKWLVSM